MHLPKRLRPPLKSGGRRPERFGLEEFVERVARREDSSADSVRETTRAVMTTLAEVVGRGEIDYLRAQLSPDYSAVLPEGEAAPRQEAAPRPAEPLGAASH
jgi:uncharacterized protein (DUF2267 family)